MTDTNSPRRTRIYKPALGAYLLIVAVAAFGFWTLGNQDDHIIEGQKAACESANDSRSGQRTVWTFFFTVTKANAKATNQPQAVIDFYNDYIAWINEEVLPDRDCDDLTKTYPEPGPPPSFKEALKEAKKQGGGE